jgi:diphthine methyl ester acylhydrolase
MALEITDFQSRTAPEDLDTIEICRAYPDLMVFGTYSLVGKEREYDAQIRRGSIEVITVSPVFQQAYPGMLLPKLARHDFSAAVLDIHFHPEDKTLLGVALSNGQIHFFRFLRRGDVLGRRIITELLPLGQATIAEADETGLIPLVTQFTWLPCIQTIGRRDVSNTLSASLAATLSSHTVKIAKIRIPGIKSTNDPRLSRSAVDLPTITEEIHSHDLEAWTVASLPILNFDGSFQHILLSGGDDSRLIASVVEQENCKTGSINKLLISPPTLMFSDRRTHSAGVTSILPLPEPRCEGAKPMGLLTGSYDESMYLHVLNPHTRRPSLVTSVALRGGVWRLELMDHYSIRLPGEQNGPPERVKQQRYQTHYIVLVSCMHAGARIVRVIYTPNLPKQDSTQNTTGKEGEKGDEEWKIDVEALFTKGHETLVYCCDFRKEWIEEPLPSAPTFPGLPTLPDPKPNGDTSTSQPSHKETKSLKSNTTSSTTTVISLNKTTARMRVSGDVGRYTIVSTSFYDRQICVWGWRDGVRRGVRMRDQV